MGKKQCESPNIRIMDLPFSVTRGGRRGAGVLKKRDSIPDFDQATLGMCSSSADRGS